MKKFHSLGWLILLSAVLMGVYKVGDNVFRLGDGTDSDKTIQINNGSANEPAIKYSATADAWQFSNNGTDFATIPPSASNLGVNSILNPDFELNTSGWSTYDDGAVGSPVDGTGGSPAVVVLSQTTSAGEVLRGGASAKLAKSASDAQGEGVSVDLDIDPADAGEALEVRFVYSTSANYASGDIGAYLYCDLDGTPAYVTLVIDGGSDELIPATSGAKDPVKFNFTAPAEAALDCRLIFHVKTTNALAYDFIFDDVAVGPPVGGSVPLATDSVAGLVSTTTQTFGGEKTFLNTTRLKNTGESLIWDRGDTGVEGVIGYDATNIDPYIGSKTAHSFQIRTNNIPYFLFSTGNGMKVSDADATGSSVQAMVHVEKGDSGAGPPSAANGLFIESSAATGMAIGSPNTESGRITFADPEDSDVGMIFYSHVNNSMGIYANALEMIEADGGNNQVNVRHDGTSAGAATACFSSASAGLRKLGPCTASSRTIKKNIRDLTDMTVEGLRPVRFDYKDENLPQNQIGLIAEEVAETHPELAKYREDGLPYDVNYEHAVALLILEMQRLKDSVAELREELDQLKDNQ